MTKHFFLGIGIVSFLFFTSCGHRQFSQGEYDDMSQDRLLDDKFNESDLRMMADSMVNSLVGSPLIMAAKKKPVVLVTMAKNRTQEHIDMKSLTDKIRVNLSKSGRVSFSAKEARSDIAEEIDYQEGSGYVDPASARKKGKQIGADFFLTGEITDRVQEVGNKKYVYYKATFNLINIDTGLIDWTDEKEIRKFYKKRSVGL